MATDFSKYGTALPPANAISFGNGAPQQPSLSQKIWESLASTGTNIANTFMGGGNPAEKGSSIVAQAVGAPIKAVKDVISPMISPEIKAGFNAGQQALPSPTAALSKLSDMLGSTKLAQDFVTKHPDAAKFIDTVAGTAGNLAGAAGDVAVLTGAGEAALKVPKVAENLYSAITSQSPEQVDAYITKQFEKGVRPSVSGKGTAVLGKAYQNKALDAVKTIVENKPNLNLVDEFGEPTGKLPENLKQFADAISQTKTQIFSKYDALAKAAGEQGATVDLNPTVTELRKVVESAVIQDLHPEVASYAKMKADALEQRGSYGAEDAQAAIKNLNNSLDAFYKNPSYETASLASIDALVANKLRTGLDTAIENAGGSGYQELKNQYGSLRTIEKDVMHRAIVDARKNNKGLLDFTDILTAGEVINGLATLSPSTVATGIFARTMKEYYKYLNDPNTAIKRLFKSAESGFPNRGTPQIPGEKVDMALPNNNTPSGGMSSNKDFVYHYTPQDNLNSISEKGLLTGKRGEIFSSENLGSFKLDGDVILRYPKGNPTKEWTLSNGKVFTHDKNIPPSLIEVSKDGGITWNPLSSPKGEGAIPETTKSPVLNAIMDYIKNPKIGLSMEDVSKKPGAFQGFSDITTKLVEKLRGHDTVSKQFISDLTNSPDLKQAEKDLIRRMLEDEGEKVNVKDFANKVKIELLSLEPASAVEAGHGHEGVILPDEVRGPVANYEERVYQSPIKTSAGGVHYSAKDFPGYFAHTRIEDLPPSTKGMNPEQAGEYLAETKDKGNTRRVIELQSDLFQKGSLEQELPNIKNTRGTAKDKVNLAKREAEIAKLEPYRNTWHERVIREEVKQAAKDGKTKLQFPTGETAMKIEGLVNRTDKWVTLDNDVVNGKNIKKGDLITYQTHEGTPHEDRRFLITKNNGDGTFEAVDSMTAESDSGFYDLIKKKDLLDDGRMPTLEELEPHLDKELTDYLSKISEQLSAKDTIDANNPIYRFYEKEVGKYLTNKYGAKRITDPQGVQWWEVPIKKEMKRLPVEAFGVVGAIGAGAAMQNNNGR